MSRLTTVVAALAIFVLSASVANAAECTGERTYRVTYNYMWTNGNFPNRPSGAHFSPLVVWAHKITYSAFTQYGYATDGIKDVAEFGASSALRSELMQGRANGFVGDIKVNGRIPNGGGMASVDLKVNCTYPFISAISMVAPSPDWIAPVFRFSVIRNKNNMYKKKGSKNVRVWDAGTDSGLDFTSPNAPTSPRENIHPIPGPLFNDEKPIAVFRILRL